MLTLLIALLCGCAAGWGSGKLLDNYSWGTLIGIVVLILVQLVIGLVIRRKVTRIHGEIQQLMEAAQTRIQRKINQLQLRPGMSQKTMQEVLEKEQKQAVQSALQVADRMRPYYRWSPLLKKQIDTMKMMFHYQIKEFAEVDKLLPNCLFLEPQTCAVKIARMYRKNDPGLDKFARSKIKRAKGDAGVILYALYSWILVQRNDVAGAIALLAESQKRCDSEVLRQNQEKLANNKVKNFSNAALGDRWYMLYLETPKIRTQKARYA